MNEAELIRAAAELIRKGGWSQGAAARDAMGNQIPLFTAAATGQTDASRASINPAAVSFSIYGALAKIGYANSGAVSMGMLWQTMADMARLEPCNVAHVHPIIAYNDHDGRTQDEVLDFMERCARQLEPKESAA